MRTSSSPLAAATCTRAQTAAPRGRADPRSQCRHSATARTPSHSRPTARRGRSWAAGSTTAPTAASTGRSWAHLPTRLARRRSPSPRGIPRSSGWDANGNGRNVVGRRRHLAGSEPGTPERLRLDQPTDRRSGELGERLPAPGNAGLRDDPRRPLGADIRQRRPGRRLRDRDRARLAGDADRCRQPGDSPIHGRRGNVVGREPGARIVDISSSVLAVDPANASSVSFGGSGVYHSTDGAASFGWLPNASGAGGLNVLVADPSDGQRLFAGTDSNGVVRSDDGGATWQPTGAGVVGQVRGLAADPYHPGVLFAAAGNDLYRSDDDGDTWQPTDSGMSGVENAVAADPDSAGTLYANGGAVVYRSTDDGHAWSPCGSTGSTFDLSALAVDPTDDSTIYAAGPYGIFRSTDGCSDWTTISPNNADALSVGPDGTAYAASGAGAIAFAAGSSTGIESSKANGYDLPLSTYASRRFVPPGRGIRWNGAGHVRDRRRRRPVSETDHKRPHVDVVAQPAGLRRHRTHRDHARWQRFS